MVELREPARNPAPARELLTFAHDSPGGTMLTVISLVSAAFGVSIAGALLPLISVEVFVIGLAVSDPELPLWLLALVIALGQAAGKLLYYYAAQGVRCLPRFLRRKSESAPRGRWSRWLEQFQQGCHRRPVFTGGVLLLSATVSLPPFAVSSVVAGWARIGLPTFLSTAVVGRFCRYGALLLAPALVTGWI